MRDRTNRRAERRSAKPRLIRASYFVWLAAIGGLWWGYVTHGLPHMIWSYSFHMAGTRNTSDFAARRYERCTYVGPYGPFTTAASSGRCPWIAFRHADHAGGAQ